MHKLRQEFSAIKFLENKAPEPEKQSAPVLIRFFYSALVLPTSALRST